MKAVCDNQSLHLVGLFIYYNMFSFCFCFLFFRGEGVCCFTCITLIGITKREFPRTVCVTGRIFTTDKSFRLEGWRGRGGEDITGISRNF